MRFKLSPVVKVPNFETIINNSVYAGSKLEVQTQRGSYRCEETLLMERFIIPGFNQVYGYMAQKIAEVFTAKTPSENKLAGYLASLMDNSEDQRLLAKILSEDETSSFHDLLDEHYNNSLQGRDFKNQFFQQVKIIYGLIPEGLFDNLVGKPSADYKLVMADRSLTDLYLGTRLDLDLVLNNNNNLPPLEKIMVLLESGAVSSNWHTTNYFNHGLKPLVKKALTSAYAHLTRDKSVAENIKQLEDTTELLLIDLSILTINRLRQKGILDFKI